MSHQLLDCGGALYIDGVRLKTTNTRILKIDAVKQCTWTEPMFIHTARNHRDLAILYGKIPYFKGFLWLVASLPMQRA